MDSANITKEQVLEFCRLRMQTHTDWSGTRVESKRKCGSVDEFADCLWNWIKDNAN